MILTIVEKFYFSKIVEYNYMILTLYSITCIVSKYYFQHLCYINTKILSKKKKTLKFDSILSMLDYII